jgi:hypothetical protein
VTGAACDAGAGYRPARAAFSAASQDFELVLARHGLDHDRHEAMVLAAQLGALATVGARLWIWVQASLMKPGMASCFQPSAGTHQAWITSSAVITKRILVSVGQHQRG